MAARGPASGGRSSRRGSEVSLGHSDDLSMSNRRSSRRLKSDAEDMNGHSADVKVEETAPSSQHRKTRSEQQQDSATTPRKGESKAAEATPGSGGRSLRKRPASPVELGTQQDQQPNQKSARRSSRHASTTIATGESRENQEVSSPRLIRFTLGGGKKCVPKFSLDGCDKSNECDAEARKPQNGNVHTSPMKPINSAAIKNVEERPRTPPTRDEIQKAYAHYFYEDFVRSGLRNPKSYVSTPGGVPIPKRQEPPSPLKSHPVSSEVFQTGYDATAFSQQPVVSVEKRLDDFVGSMGNDASGHLDAFLSLIGEKSTGGSNAMESEDEPAQRGVFHVPGLEGKEVQELVDDGYDLEFLRGRSFESGSSKTSGEDHASALISRHSQLICDLQIRQLRRPNAGALSENELSRATCLRDSLYQTVLNKS